MVLLQQNNWLIIFGLCVIVFFTIIIISITLGEITYHQCKNECKKIDGITWIRIQSSKWDLKDTCICFLGNDNYKIIELM